MIEGGKLKKVYSITSEGEKKFYSWTNSPLESLTTKNPELTKIFFMGFSEKENRVNILKSYIVEMRKILERLECICNEGEIINAELQENAISFYQLQTAKYGRDIMRFNIEWYGRFLEEIKEKAE